MYRHTHAHHVGQGYYWCQSCGHMVQPGSGGCRSCQTPLADLMLYDDFFGNGGTDMFGSPIGFDPYDGDFAFNLGDGLAIEPDGQIDMQVGGFDIPI